MRSGGPTSKVNLQPRSHLTSQLDVLYDNGKWQMTNKDRFLSIEHWLNSVCDGRKKAIDMDVHDTQDTPRAKKIRATLPSPPVSSGNNTIPASVLSFREPPQLLSSKATSSRSSSPSKSKRQRELEIEFSKPAFDFLTASDSRQWSNKHADRIPHLRELLQHITNPAASLPVNNTIPDIERKLDAIIQDIERCIDRSATEESWSDLVVLPALQLARELSTKQLVEVINVKSIDVYPTELLPTNARNDQMLKKRVDYTIGLTVVERDSVIDLLRHAEHHTVAQSDHKMLRDQALCSHIEIKTEGDTQTARFQLSTWCAAGFQKQENLWSQRYRTQQEIPVPVLAPITLWLWQGTVVKLWIAVMDSANAKVYVLDVKGLLIDVTDSSSLRRVIDTLASVMSWGQSYYLPWFRTFLDVGELSKASY